MFSTIRVILSLDSRARTVTALNYMKMSMNRIVILLRRIGFLKLTVWRGIDSSRSEDIFTELWDGP